MTKQVRKKPTIIPPIKVKDKINFVFLAIRIFFIYVLPTYRKIYIEFIMYEKSVGVHTVTRPTSEGLRIAQSS